MHGIGGGAIAVEPALVKGLHPRAGGLVLYRPQAHDHRPGPRDLERSAKPEHAFPSRNLAHSRVARGEHGPLHAAQVQAGHLLRCEDTVVTVRAGQRAAVCPDRARPESSNGFSAGRGGRPTNPPTPRVLTAALPPQASLKKNPCVARWRTRYFPAELERGLARLGSQKQRGGLSRPTCRPQAGDLLCFGDRASERLKLQALNARTGGGGAGVSRCHYGGNGCRCRRNRCGRCRSRVAKSGSAEGQNPLSASLSWYGHVREVPFRRQEVDRRRVFEQYDESLVGSAAKGHQADRAVGDHEYSGRVTKVRRDRFPNRLSQGIASTAVSQHRGFGIAARQQACPSGFAAKRRDALLDVRHRAQWYQRHALLAGA